MLFKTIRKRLKTHETVLVQYFKIGYGILPGNQLGTDVLPKLLFSDA